VTFTLESYDAAREIVRVIVGMHATWGVLLVGALLAFWFRKRVVAVVVDRHISRWRAAWSAMPLRPRLRAVMKAAFIYFSAAIWIGSGVARSTTPESHYLAPLVFPLVFLAADEANALSARQAAILFVIGFVALLAFPFAVVASRLTNVLLVVFSAFAVLRTIAWAARGRWSLAGSALSTALHPALVYVIVAAILAGSIPDTILVRRERLSWPIAPAEKLAKTLYQSGLSFSQIMASSQRQAPTLMQYASMVDPSLFGAPQDASDPGWSLLALIVEPSVAARTEGVWFSFPVRGSKSAMVVRAPSYLDRTHLRTCYLRTCDEEPTADDCTEREPQQPISHLPPYFAIDRHKPDRPGELFAYERSGRYCTLFFVPLHTVGSGVTHAVRVVDQWPLHLRITRVSGIAFEGALPGANVALLDTRQATGTLTVAMSSDGPGPPSDWLEDPPIVEVTAANEHLLKRFERASML
jgi:hypothetical protein